MYPVGFRMNFTQEKPNSMFYYWETRATRSYKMQSVMIKLWKTNALVALMKKCNTAFLSYHGFKFISGSILFVTDLKNYIEQANNSERVGPY